MNNVIPFRPSVSRDFLIGQAVLQAAAKHWPWGVQHFTVEKVLRDITAATEWQLGFFADEVRQEYRILTGSYTEVDDHAVTDEDFSAFAADLSDGRTFL